MKVMAYFYLKGGSLLQFISIPNTTVIGVQPEVHKAL